MEKNARSIICTYVLYVLFKLLGSLTSRCFKDFVFESLLWKVLLS